MLVEAVRPGFPPSAATRNRWWSTATPFMERLRDLSGETVLLSTMNAHCRRPQAGQSASATILCVMM